MFTGMRRGELFKLEWRDIDFERGFIHIRHPKGGKSQKIPLNDVARAVLESHPHVEGSPYVFPGQGGKQRVTIQVASNRIKARAGLPADFRPLHVPGPSLVPSTGQKRSGTPNGGKPTINGKRTWTLGRMPNGRPDEERGMTLGPSLSSRSVAS